MATTNCHIHGCTPPCQQRGHWRVRCYCRTVEKDCGDLVAEAEKQGVPLSVRERGVIREIGVS